MGSLYTNTVGLVALVLTITAQSQSAFAQCAVESRQTGESSLEFLGYSVGDAGDVNNDGFADFIVGAYLNDELIKNGGKAWIISGETGLPLHVFRGVRAGEQLGTSVSGAGDINKDGFSDVIIGSRLNSDFDLFGGRVNIFSGHTGQRLFSFYGERSEDFFGSAVADAGDINKDGYPDVVVGAPGYDKAGDTLNSGRVYVYSGRDGALLRVHDGETEGDSFGSSVAGAGDVNNDGYSDIIVGAIFYDGWGDHLGRAYVYSGWDGSLIWQFQGEDNGENLGYSVDGAGDIDIDGYDDVLVGGPNNDRGGDNAGRVYVYSGRTRTLIHELDGTAVNSWLGFSVSGKKDIDGDGFPDIVAGAPNYSSGVDNDRRGRVVVFSGLTGDEIAVNNGDGEGDSFGFSVANLGDSNGDGFGDIAVGAPLFSSAGMEHDGRAYLFRCVGLQTDVIEVDVVALVESFALHQNYPNPFNPITRIKIDLPEVSAWSLAVYNISGQLVDEFDGSAGPGIVTIEWDASDNASGLYLYKLSAGEFSQTRKMILLK